GGTDNGNTGTDNSNSGTDNGNGGSDNSNNGTDKNKLDKVPKTGDNSLSQIFYMALALISLMMLGFLLFGSKKKKRS
ncbi:LPXTG cell wall anchor domain-containing protein, partial [Cytobacillus sp.]|uniref:LPXTG cell wall anchor domain-containing protein n=1 Tax=Cytobacillus sp. TaxID=2675269 RepID=UPI0028BDF41C